MLATAPRSKELLDHFLAEHFFAVDSRRERGEPFHREHARVLVARSIEFENHAAVPWELGSAVFQR
jgi:hypothetical protein